MEPINKQPHILVLPYPGQGHIKPMLQFCKRLANKGIKITFVNTLYISKSMHKVHQTDPNPIALETIFDGYDEGSFAQAGSPEAYLSRFKEVGSKAMSDLIQKLELEGNHVDVVLYDGMILWAIDVAKKFGILVAFFFTQSCAVNAIYYHVLKNLLPLPLSSSEVSVPGLPMLEPSETPSYVHIYGSYPGYYDMVVNQFINIDQADWVFSNTFYELEGEVLEWMTKLWNVKTIGPTIPSMYLDKRLLNDKDYGMDIFKPKSSECMSWLADKPKRSIVYVSFGSMAQLGAGQMEEMAWGLNDGDFNFLWVVRESEEEKLPKEFMEKQSQKGLVVTWCPQLEVLSHELIGCFVTHCGFNSVLESISLGVPMVAMPQWTDQPTNAKYVEDVWRMGLRAKTDDKGIVRREVLKGCIREVMEGQSAEEIRKNAMNWSRLAKEAVSGGGSSDKNIEEFVLELIFKLL